MSSREFAGWLRYLEIDVNAFHREDYYLAQIAAEIRQQNSKTSVEVRDFLLKFKHSDAGQYSNPITEEEKEQHRKKSKAVWGALLGVAIPHKKKE